MSIPCWGQLINRPGAGVDSCTYTIGTPEFPEPLRTTGKYPTSLMHHLLSHIHRPFLVVYEVDEAVALVLRVAALGHMDMTKSAMRRTVSSLAIKRNGRH